MSEGPIRRRLLGLCLPFLVVLAVDGGLTLAGQPSDYWTGNYAHVQEAHVTFKKLLQTHPIAFVAGCVFVGATTSAIILLLPLPLAMTASLAAIIGHTYGAATWLGPRFAVSYIGYELFFCSVALMFSLCFTMSCLREGDRVLLANRPVARSILLVALIAILIYTFLL